jgi:DNA-binding Xre family transcriptional regulator
MISFHKFWVLLQERNISQYQLTHVYGISSGQLYRIRHNEYVSTKTLETLCLILECRVEDICEYVPEPDAIICEVSHD